jgi:hypothetical protein
MPSVNFLPDRDSLRKELRILQEEQDKALALAAYFRMSTLQAKQYEQRRRRIRELLFILSTLPRLRRAVRRG